MVVVGFVGVEVDLSEKSGLVLAYRLQKQKEGKNFFAKENTDFFS